MSTDTFETKSLPKEGFPTVIGCVIGRALLNEDTPDRTEDTVDKQESSDTSKVASVDTWDGLPVDADDDGLVAVDEEKSRTNDDGSLEDMTVAAPTVAASQVITKAATTSGQTVVLNTKK